MKNLGEQLRDLKPDELDQEGLYKHLRDYLLTGGAFDSMQKLSKLGISHYEQCVPGLWDRWDLDEVNKFFTERDGVKIELNRHCLEGGSTWIGIRW